MKKPLLVILLSAVGEEGNQNSTKSITLDHHKNYLILISELP